MKVCVCVINNTALITSSSNHLCCNSCWSGHQLLQSSLFIFFLLSFLNFSKFLSLLVSYCGLLFSNFNFLLKLSPFFLIFFLLFLFCQKLLNCLCSSHFSKQLILSQLFCLFLLFSFIFLSIKFSVSKLFFKLFLLPNFSFLNLFHLFLKFKHFHILIINFLFFIKFLQFFSIGFSFFISRDFGFHFSSFNKSCESCFVFNFSKRLLIIKICEF